MCKMMYSTKFYDLIQVILMYIREGGEPRTEPCVTPNFIKVVSDV